ncbi:hypothetical protein FIBSPDRAFT_262878 [Athelia psychrophila]|uniref:Uncharacterized protein n=1 Tax=Athelia psychrophila TaxID=1759441 RepID=A0A165XDU5_9AGAM|nr:hypothetical protein FIBSPDRAFT_262878 [Fibularhizoctonia sp. CBS 109695]
MYSLHFVRNLMGGSMCRKLRGSKNKMHELFASRQPGEQRLRLHRKLKRTQHGKSRKPKFVGHKKRDRRRHDELTKNGKRLRLR